MEHEYLPLSYISGNGSKHALTIVTEKTCVLPSSVQKFIGKEALLLLTFFLYLHNHLISIYSIAT